MLDLPEVPDQNIQQLKLFLRSIAVRAHLGKTTTNRAVLDLIVPPTEIEPIPLPESDSFYVQAWEFFEKLGANL